MARVRMLCAAAVLGGLTAAPPAAAAQPSSPEELAAAIVRPAIVFVQVRWHGWVRDRQTGEVFGGPNGYEVTASCSGVVINPAGYVATASHCVHTGPDGGSGALFDAAIADLARIGRIGDPGKARQALAEHAVAEGATPDSPVDRDIQVERMTAGGEETSRDVAPATVANVVAPTDGDVAVLKVPRDRLPAVRMREDPPPVGTPILAVGYPASAQAVVDPNLEPSTKNGQISAHRTQQKRPFYEFSAAATHGMSGGPVVDTQGRLVGLVSQGAPGETQSFNLASAVSTLQDVLREKGIVAEQGAHDRNYREGLDRYFAGDYDGAVEFLDAVLAAAPTHQQAAEYRRLAVERGGVPGSGNTPLVIIAVVCGSVAVAAAVTGAAVLVSARRRLSQMDTPPYGIPIIAQSPAQPTETSGDRDVTQPQSTRQPHIKG